MGLFGKKPLISFAMVMTLALALMAAILPVTAAAAPLSWSLPQQVDGAAVIRSIDCPSTGLCVAGDELGGVVTTTDPTGGWEAWHRAQIAPSSPDAILGVSCPSSGFCAAIDSGHVWTSRNPTGGTTAWKSSPIGTALTGISCPSSELCVATDGFGDILTSTNPGGGSAAWQHFGVDSENEGYFSVGNPTVVCPSTSLCLAVHVHSGNIISSSNPTGGSSAWSVAHVINGEGLQAISCASATFCVAVASAPVPSVLTSTNPTGSAAAWSASPLNVIAATTVSCPTSSLCTAGGFVSREEGFNVAVSADPAGGGSTWQASKLNPAPGDHPTTAVSCPTAELCVLADGQGDVYVGTPSGEEAVPLPPAPMPEPAPSPAPVIPSPSISVPAVSPTMPSTPNTNTAQAPTKPKPLRCKRHFRKRRVHGRERCVKIGRRSPTKPRD